MSQYVFKKPDSEIGLRFDSTPYAIVVRVVKMTTWDKHGPSVFGPWPFRTSGTDDALINEKKGKEENLKHTWTWLLIIVILVCRQPRYRLTFFPTPNKKLEEEAKH